MAENSKIEWTHHTFNPWGGCQKVGPGCDNCYAEARDVRFTGGAHWGPGSPRRRTSPANWRKPLAWDKAAAVAGERHRVFCASLADVFDNAVDPAWREDLWRLIWATPNLDWLLLTKRPGNIIDMLPKDGLDHPSFKSPWPHVWLGCSVVNQAEADRDVPKLLAVPAAVRFLSMEPLLGPVDLARWLRDLCPNCLHVECTPTLRSDSAEVFSRCGRFVMETPRPLLDLIIVGGESGPHARLIYPDWARSLRDQCNAAGVAFFFKQWGEWLPMGQSGFTAWSAANVKNNGANGRKWLGFAHFNDGAGGRETERIGPHETCNVGNMLQSVRVGKARAGRNLDGRTWDQMPGVADD